MSEPAETLEPLETPARLAALRLAMITGVGPRIRQVLLEHFGNAEAVLNAAPSELRAVPGVGPKLSSAIARSATEIDVAAELALCRQHKITLLAAGEADYPAALAEIPDPPGVLYVRGALEPRDGLAVAIVGSRHATQYGLAQAERLASSLARAGLTIVSGLARGVDAAAHRGALAAGGRTLAVLGSGVLNIYPPEHERLAAEVAAGGALISENSLHAEPFSGSFPQRNRLISGLSLGIIVVEASTHSGALITARHALEQGREVFAVPGRVDNRMSHGCHRLLRDGARLVESADDVLDELGPPVTRVPLPSGEVVHHPAELSLNDLERQVLAAIGSSTASIDQVVSASGLPTPQVLSTLSVLEMRRLVRRLSGNLVTRP
ncbi:MAG TPA: DNA-processing protein DprA [Pirellulales bacterium]|jgi:DNA processing protein|nr:DNA-processing protein DprA [Pirellulales bacterium]